MNRFILFFLTLPIFFSACQPEDDLPPTSTAPCEFSWELTPSPGDTCFQVPRDIQGTILSEGIFPYYRMPEYHPDDASRLAVIRGIDAPPDEAEEMKILDLCSEADDLSVAMEVALVGNSRMQWGRNDKIAFTPGGRLHIFDLTSNELILWGQGAGAHSRPAWFFGGAQLYVLRKFEGQSYHLLLDDETGVTADSLEIPLILPKERNNKITGQSRLGEIGYFQIPGSDFIPLTQELWTTLDLDWQDDEHILWTTHQGFFRVNTESAQVDTIRFTPCDNRRYFFFSVDPKNNNHILIDRKDYRYSLNDSLFLHNEIVLLDLETDEEWIVNFE